MQQELLDKLHNNIEFINEEALKHKTLGAITNNLILTDLLISKSIQKDLNICLHSQLFNNLKHSHDFFELVFVYKGYVIEEVDEVTLRLNAGEACIHNPNAEHSIIKFDENEDILLNIIISKDMFNKSFFEKLLVDKNLASFFNHYMTTNHPKNDFMVFHNLSAHIETIIDLLLKEFLDTENFSQIVLEAILVMLFGELLRDFRRKDPNYFAGKIIDYISENLSTVTLKEASAYFNYHPKYFSFLVKQNIGKTFKDIVISLRLQKCASLLTFTNDCIDDIQEKIGYKDKSSLYANFKKHYKLTPKQYRTLRKQSINR
ncbi:MAG: AraC family transcriptional regulator [Clostridia bacterium]|nr:AraC family transcriptional regulator [Clostridia bacterium]